MSRLQKLLTLIPLAMLLLPILNCGSAHDADEKYFLIASNVQIPYWQTAAAGFSQSASQLKVRAEIAGPDTFDPQDPSEVEEALSRRIRRTATGGRRS